MPELPEVETVRRTLLPRVRGRRIVDVRVREARLRTPVAEDFAAKLVGRSVADLRRVGKYLLFDLDDGRVWLVHLGMTGCLATRSAGRERHDHVHIALSDGTQLVYNDPRRFGLMRVADEPEELSGLGVDPLSTGYTAEYLHAVCRGRARPIKTLLMDQAVVAGLGNIYVSEILFHAGVRPSRRSGTLRRRELIEIQAATRAVLERAIRKGGSSISDYRDGEGRTGYFQLELDVYDRRGEPCHKCGAAIRGRILSGRSSFYCPACQK